MNAAINKPENSNDCKRCDYIRELLTLPTTTDTNTNNQDTDDLHLDVDLNTMGLVIDLNIK